MLGVGVVQRNDISFVLAWPRHVQILVGPSLRPNAHVELRLFSAVLEVSFDCVVVGSGSKELLLQIITSPSSELGALVDPSWVLWLVALRPHRISNDTPFFILVISDLFLLRDYPEARERVEFLRVV